MNLLPEEYKRGLRYEVRARFIKVFGFYLGAITLVASVLLLPTLFFLYFQIDAERSRLEVLAKTPEHIRVLEAENKIERINKSLSLLSSQTRSVKSFYPLLEDITNRVGSSTHLANIKYTRNPDGTAMLNIAGVAEKREALREFIKTLEQNPRLKNVDVPISDFLKEENITFNLTADVLAR